LVAANLMELDLIKVKQELASSIEAISQSRSNFAITNFVVGDYTTPERQFSQCVLELQIKLFNIKRDEIKMRKLLKKMELEQDVDEKELLQLDVEELTISILSQKREAGTLYSIYSALPKFSYKQIQEAEEVYWQERLARQAQMDIASTGRIGVGNMDALRQAGILRNDFAETFYKQTLAAPEQKELK
jgi:hypothetical protein